MPKKTPEPEAVKAPPVDRFPEPAPDAPIFRRRLRTKREKLVGLVDGNPSFRGFVVDEHWTDAQLETAIRLHINSSHSQTIGPRGARLEAPERED